MKTSMLPVLFAGLCASVASAQAPLGLCRFDQRALSFGGTTAEQTACLLRRAKEHGSGSDPQSTPDWLLQRVGTPVPITVAQMQHYLDENGIGADAIGGLLAAGDAASTRYFARALSRQ